MKNHSEKSTKATSLNTNQVRDMSFFEKTNKENFFSKTTMSPDFIQRQQSVELNEPQNLEYLNKVAFSKMMNEWFDTDKILDPMVRQLAKSYANRPGQLNTPDRIVYDTPYGGDKIIPGIKPKSEERIYYAIYPRIKLKRIGKGKDIKDWTFTWRDNNNTRKKTHDEKLQDIGMYGANELVDTVKDSAIKYESKVVQAAIKVSVEFALDRGMVAAVLFASGAGEVICTALAIYGLAELLLGFDEPVEKELSHYEQESENIVEGVKNFLQHKKDAAEAKKNFMQIPAMKSDRLSPNSMSVVPAQKLKNLSIGE
jgi:hypothetical protein